MGRHLRVELGPADRRQLERMVRLSSTPERVRIRAHILLLADRAPSRGVSTATGTQVAEDAQVCRSTVGRVCRRYVQEGMEAALGASRAGVPLAGKRRKVSEAVLLALKDIEDSVPPAGDRWTLLQLRDELVRRGVVSSVSPTSVHHWRKEARRVAAVPGDSGRTNKLPLHTGG